ncbi:hypothetical protein NKH57_26780 [Mesorhizobium sp. M1050]|uniref:hypothetical protein n=1 Tax=Mesorhizobium sp. M1050 TaxID=2957051 RepID=UPI0033381752
MYDLSLTHRQSLNGLAEIMTATNFGLCCCLATPRREVYRYGQTPAAPYVRYQHAIDTLEQQLGLSLFDRAAVSVRQPALRISVTMASASFTPLP